MIYIDHHLHDSTGSLLDSVLKINDLVQHAKENNLPALFISNHGSYSSSFDFYQQCKKNNILPISGIEFYLTENLEEKINDNYHICAYAKNNDGHKDLIKLISIANKENYYYKGRITNDLLKQFSSNIIVTTACIRSNINSAIINDDYEKAEQIILFYKNIFKDDFYLELQLHNSPHTRIIKADKHSELVILEQKCNKFLVEMSKKHKIRPIIGNDSHMLKREDSVVHEILLCKNTNTSLSDEKRFVFPNDEFYFKNYEEILETYTYNGYDKDFIDYCVKSTHQIIDKCKQSPIEIQTGIYDIPKFPIPEGFSTEMAYLIHLVKKNVKSRYPKITKEVIDRINHELKVINKMDLAGYFLMVEDYITWARNNGIMVGAGRGSNGGSIICFILKITQLCPLKYDLTFSRFLDVSRKSDASDMDVDFMASRRDEVIQYFRNKYGHDKTSHIGTTNTLKIKGAIKVVAKAMEYSFEKINEFCKNIEDTEDNFENVLKIKEGSDYYKNDEELDKILNIANKMSGLPQSAGVHPAGILVASNDITDKAPVAKFKDVFATSYSMTEVDKLGLLKMDFLGLKTLDIISDCLSLVKQRHGLDIDIYNIDIDDQNIYKMLSSGDNESVFQFEEFMAKKLLMDLKPTNLVDLAVITSINRPAPLSMGVHTEYKKYKENPELIEYAHPKLKPILEKTYGQIIFQETAMEISKKLAGFDDVMANKFRKAAAKKIDGLLQEIKPIFINGCMTHSDWTEEQANNYFTFIEGLSSYLFNASHAHLYSFISYQTAWLKYYYPVEFMCSVLKNTSDDDEKKNKYLVYCAQKCIKVNPPDINDSDIYFSISDNNEIMFGLSAIKGIGIKQVEKIVKERTKHGKFKSFIDFCERCQPNKKVIEALLLSNCFKDMEQYPKRWLDNIYALCECISDSKKYGLGHIYSINPLTGHLQGSIFEAIAKHVIKDHTKINEFTEAKKAISGQSKSAKEERAEIDMQIELEKEKILNHVKKQFTDNHGQFTKQEIKENEIKYLSYQITTNPMFIFQKYKKYFKDVLFGKMQYKFLPLDEFDYEYINTNIATVGEIKSYRAIKTKNGKNMAFASIKYNDTEVSITIFPSQFDSIKIDKGDFVLLYGKLEESRDKEYGDYNIIAGNCNILDCISTEDEILFDITSLSEEKKQIFKSILANHSNACYNKNMKITRMLKLKSGDKIETTNARFWISDEKELWNMLMKYGIY